MLVFIEMLGVVQTESGICYKTSRAADMYIYIERKKIERKRESEKGKERERERHERNVTERLSARACVTRRDTK